MRLANPMDPEVVDLCVAMNALPGLETIESCCGHGRTPFHIWFRVNSNDPRGLFILARVINKNYTSIVWRINVTTSDIPYTPLPISYCLESQAVGEQAYDEAQHIAKCLKEKWDNDEFLQIYHIQRD